MNTTNIINDPLKKEKFFVKAGNKKEWIINVFRALSDSSIYFRTKSKLNGSAYLVGVKRYVKKLLRNIDFERLTRTYNTYLGLNSKVGGIKQRLKSWIKKDRIPCEVLRIISLSLFNTTKEQEKIMIKSFKDMNYITDRSGTSRFKPPLTIKEILSPQRLYDIGVAMGDGSLGYDGQEICDGSVEGNDLELAERYLKKVKRLKINMWGLSSKSMKVSLGIKENKNMYKLSVKNKFYAHYLNRVYGLPFGNKLKKGLKEPEILNYVLDYERNYLRRLIYRGLFDSDGSYAKGSSSISFWSNSKILIEQSKKFLKDNKIKFNTEKHEIRILAESYRKFIETIGCNHERKLKIISKRISIPPKSYVLKRINKKKIVGNFFDFKETNFNVKELGKLFRKHRLMIGLTQRKYAEEYNLKLQTIRAWESERNNIPIKEIFRIVELNGMNPLKELSKEVEYLNTNKIKLPLKVTNELVEIAEVLIPQKSFNNACVIRREGKKLKKEELTKLIGMIENHFNCKVTINAHTNAFYVHNTKLALFLNTFFIYEKSWSPMNKEEFEGFYRNMNKFLEADMEEKLPFEKTQREVVIKKESTSNPDFGCNPDERSVEENIKFGIINLNKPSGPR